MRRRIPCIVATAVLVQTVVVPFAAAQSEPAPAVELAAGYQSGLFDPYESGAWPPPAWFGSASFKRTGRLAVEVEFTGLRTRVTDVARFFHPDFPDAGDGRKERKNQLYTLTSGVRYAWRGSRLSPFVRVLGGLFSSRARTDYVWPPEAAQVNANCGVYLVKPDGQEQLLTFVLCLLPSVAIGQVTTSTAPGVLQVQAIPGLKGLGRHARLDRAARRRRRPAGGGSSRAPVRGGLAILVPPRRRFGPCADHRGRGDRVREVRLRVPCAGSVIRRSPFRPARRGRTVLRHTISTPGSASSLRHRPMTSETTPMTARRPPELKAPAPAKRRCPTSAAVIGAGGR